MNYSSADVAAYLIDKLEERFDNLVLSCADRNPLIEEGEYDAIVLSCRKERRFRRDLLAFKFRIVSQGSAFGLVLPAYCNCDFTHDRRRQVPSRSKLGVWLRKINDFAPEVSIKRVHLNTFSKFQFLVRVATSTGTKEHPLPQWERYSQVVEIIDVVGRISKGAEG